MINNLNSKIKEYERILNDINLKLEYYNTLLYLRIY
jgi:hypothetical protein